MARDRSGSTATPADEASVIGNGRRLVTTALARWRRSGRPTSDSNVAAASESVRSTAFRVPFAVLVLVGLAACAVVFVLPNVGVLMPLKLAVATWGTLLLPGAVILRLLGWPRSPAAALAGCAVWSVTALAPGLVLVLASDRGLVVAILWLLLVIGAGLLLGRGKPVEMDMPPLGTTLWLVGGVGAFSALVWLGSWQNVGDAVEHIARMRKLTELDPPRSLDELGLLPPDTGLHPGYAFPLWHAAGAVTVWISGLEEGLMFRYWSSVLVPFAAAAIYGAGRRMFCSRAAGAAVCVAYLGTFAFPGGVAFFNKLSYPGFISIFVFWPLVIERTFAYLRTGGLAPLMTVAAASFAVSAIHPSYAPFMIMLIAAFLVARTVVARDRGDFRRLAAMVGALTVPFLLFLVWLYPAADSSATTLSRASAHFGTLVDTSGDLVNMKAEWLTRGGPAVVAALLLVPVATAATRTRAAAFIGGASAVGILTLIVPWFFTPFADVVSISQGRRLLFYLPFAFALTGGALVFARFRAFAVVGALALGTLLYKLWPGEYSYHLHETGPGWAAWVAAIGALAVLAAGAAGKLNVRYRNGWVLAIVVAFVLPTAVAGLVAMRFNRSVPAGINPRFVAAVKEYVQRDDVLLARPKTAYRLSSRAPIYIVAAAGGHGGDTVINRHKDRRRDANRFFFSHASPEEAQAIIDRWDVQWVLVRKDEGYPREFMAQFTPVFESRKYALYPVDPAVIRRVEAMKSEPDAP